MVTFIGPSEIDSIEDKPEAGAEPQSAQDPLGYAGDPFGHEF
jgi:hypothetical protein